MNTQRPLPRQQRNPYEQRRDWRYELVTGLLVIACVVVYGMWLFGLGGAL